MKLNSLKSGQSCFVLSISGEGAFRRRMFDMGITPSAEITVRKVAPLGDPIEISLRGYELTLRKSEAESVNVEKTGG